MFRHVFSGLEDDRAHVAGSAAYRTGVEHHTQMTAACPIGLSIGGMDSTHP